MIAALDIALFASALAPFVADWLAAAPRTRLLRALGRNRRK